MAIKFYGLTWKYGSSTSQPEQYNSPNTFWGGNWVDELTEALDTCTHVSAWEI